MEKTIEHNVYSTITLYVAVLILNVRTYVHTYIRMLTKYTHIFKWSQTW